MRKARQSDKQPIAAAEFPIAQVVVTGATSIADTATLVQPFVGRQSSVAVLTDLARAIAAVYPKYDVAFYTVEITGLDATARRVTVSAQEAYVTDIVIKGDVGRSWERKVRRILAPLLSEKPLRRSAYERALVRISNIEGLAVEASMRASDATGGIALDIQLKRRGPSLTVGFHNYGSALIGADTLEASARYAGLVTAGDEATLYYSSPTNFHRSHYVSASYALPLGDDGTTLQVSGGWLRTKLFYDLLRGRATQGAVTVSRPLLQRFGRTVTGAVGFDFINLDNALLGYRLTDDRTRTVRASLRYAEESAAHRLDAEISASQGISALGARSIMPLAQPGFSKLNLRVDYTRQVATRVLVRLKTMAQLTGARLPAAEQIAVGGSDFGRGLSAGLIAGDHGIAALGEIAFVPAMPRLLNGTEFYGFVDGASLRYVNRGPYEGYTHRAGSVGAGLRLRLNDRTGVDLGGAAVVRAPYPAFADKWRLFVTARVKIGN
ncbi:ShlB/FhaC/HecB family hemolysin secretion/activation protein [Sphingobium sp. HWE2-09]|uniref:ShlB/FhaC/HecB family hemolysin secretion/activation protein n=1 Tax=Sphingobium sp. HWE2-09 TaxID=3108390 RepID=UPI002DC94056|nr:ShlB/FhaC/HecB family hemolysin secretion/activation protein [Sphingobium sp. HWE2-09]